MIDHVASGCSKGHCSAVKDSNGENEKKYTVALMDA